jgi:hypothetical protein
MHRTRIATAVLLAGAATCTVALTAGASPRNAPPCTPKIATIAGHKGVVNCGPATATLRMGSRSYTFRNRILRAEHPAGSAPELELGTTLVGVKGNARRPDLTMLIEARVHSGSIFHADYGGKRILGDSLIDAKGNLPSKGTFTGTEAIGPKFSGSWDCHGVIWKHA